MYTRQIIKDIETYYSRYSESTSDQMLYYTTKHLIIFLYSFDIINVILSNLKKEYSYEDSKIKECEEMTGFEIIKHVAKDKKQYISYILHYLEYTFDSNQIVDFYNDASWICYNNSDYNIKERIMLFKTDVIKPLCDYVIDELRKHVSLLYVLIKFKNRTMRFETPYPSEYNEWNIQNKLALYMFDNGYDVQRENDISNGKPDFLFSDEENNSYVIEVKYVKNKKHDFKSYISQLMDYMNKLESHIGVLCIFTTMDYDFKWTDKPNHIEIITIYVGNKKPNERNSEIINYNPNL